MPPSAADLDRLRAEGWPGHAPLRWRFIEALAGRAEACDGALRERLDARLAVLLAEYEASMTARTADPSPPPAPPDPADVAAPPRPLTALLAHIAAHTAPTSELRTLARFRRTWSRLAADQRVMRSRLNLPRNAGPLNSQHLVHRAMTLMHELSPEYLECFVAHADALLWLDHATGGDLPMSRDSAAGTAGGGPRGASGGGGQAKAGRPRGTARGGRSDKGGGRR